MNTAHLLPATTRQPNYCVYLFVSQMRACYTAISRTMQSRLKHAPLAVKELGKNLLMGIGSVRARRLQGHRTSTFADSAQFNLSALCATV